MISRPELGPGSLWFIKREMAAYRIRLTTALIWARGIPQHISSISVSGTSTSSRLEVGGLDFTRRLPCNLAINNFEVLTIDRRRN